MSTNLTIAQPIIPHLVVDNAAAAIDFYKRAFGAVEQARHLTDDGQRVMHEVSDIIFPAHSVVSLEPGAMHPMLIGLTHSLVQGQVFQLTLHFAVAGDVPVEVRVRRKQDAAGVPQTPPVTSGSLTILHASAPPAPVVHG